MEHSWSKGRIPPFQGGDPGASPGGCIFERVWESVGVRVGKEGVKSRGEELRAERRGKKTSVAGLEPTILRSEV